MKVTGKAGKAAELSGSKHCNFKPPHVHSNIFSSQLLFNSQKSDSESTPAQTRTAASQPNGPFHVHAISRLTNLCQNHEVTPFKMEQTYGKEI